MELELLGEKQRNRKVLKRVHMSVVSDEGKTVDASVVRKRIGSLKGQVMKPDKTHLLFVPGFSYLTVVSFPQMTP